MIKIEIGTIRMYTKIVAPSADFDGDYTFYYDETNNIRKFYIRESDFNSVFTNNFVLGGLVHEGSAPDVRPLIDALNLQSSVKEVKLKHIAKGDFLECLESQKLNVFLKYVSASNLYVHYSSLNILYWSIVDIVDSAIAHCPASQKLGFPFANTMKNDLYKLARLEIDAIIALFNKYEYPNIKPNDVTLFIEDLFAIFEDYLDDADFHFGLESLRQILKLAKKRNELEFAVNEEDFILIKDFSQFYLRPIYLFKNSTHVFDNEDSISELLANYKIMDGLQEVKNYSFIDSGSCLLVQLSDVLVGLIGKMHSYLNTHVSSEIHADFSHLNLLQRENISLLLDLIDRSHNKNIGFLHSTDSYEEMSKFEIINSSRM